MGLNNIPIENIKSGMKLGCDIPINNKLTLKKNKTISNETIGILKYNGFTYLPIESESKSINTDKIINADWFKSIQINGILGESYKINTNMLVNRAQYILERHGSEYKIAEILKQIENYDKVTYIHSINVGLLSTVIAEWSNMSSEDINLVALGGILHDIGKTNIPIEILTKAGKLTKDEFEIIKGHPKLGYNIVKDTKMDGRVKLGILQHHEKCDGTGYPYGLKSKEIDDIAKIITIADIYDAMTSVRSYREPICSFDVIQKFEDGGLQKYEARFLYPFFRGISQNYINKEVKLSTGEIGKIVGINSYDVSRPVVSIKNNLVDLSVHRRIRIDSVITSGGAY